MNPFTIIILLAAILATAWAVRCVTHFKPDHVPKSRGVIACNVGAGTHAGSIALRADEVVADRYLIMTRSEASDADHFAICEPGQEPIGICPDEVAANEVGENRAIRLFGRGEDTLLVRCGETVTRGEDAYVGAGGKAIGEPSAEGSFYKIGQFDSSSTNGDTAELIPCDPVLVQFITLTSATTPNGADAGTTQTLANALKADMVKLKDGLTSPGLIKVI